MRNIHFTLTLLCMPLVVFTTHGQTDVIGKVNKLLDKSKYEQAIDVVNKSILKDSTNAAAYQGAALYYTAPHEAYDLDSAHKYSLLAIFYFDKLEEKSIVKLQKKGVDLTYLSTFKTHIDSLAFEKARVTHTLSSYNHFIESYQNSSLIDKVVALRNQLAFEIARAENTYHSYRSFMEMYPKAIQLDDAKARFEKLYYDESVKDGKLTSYIKFLEQHPLSDYRSLAELQILKLSTLQNKVQGYLSFINKYPESQHIQIAIAFGYHLGVIAPKLAKSKRHLTDSLKSISKFGNQALYPIYNNGYGFINNIGEIVIPIPYLPNKVSDDTLHGIYDDFIWLQNKHDQLINKLGHIFWSGDIDTLQQIGVGLIHLTAQGKHGVIHLSGREILANQYEDIRLISNRFIAAKKTGKWALYSTLGYPLTGHLFDDLDGAGEFILLQQNNKWAVSSADMLTKSIHQNFSQQFIYDECDPYNEHFIIVYQGTKSNIINTALQQKLTKSTESFTIQNNIIISNDQSGHHIISRSNWRKLITSSSPILSNNTGVYYEQDQLWNRWNESGSTVMACDKLEMLGDEFIKCTKGDSIGFSQSRLTKYPKDLNYKLLRNDAESYLQIISEDESILMNSTGNSISLGSYNSVIPLGDSLLMVEQGQDKGIINTKGKVILKTQYDAIQRLDSMNITLLDNDKFGVLNTKEFTKIEAGFDQKINPYNSAYYITKQDVYYGIIDRNNRTKISNDYDMIHYWNDTSAILKKGHQWIIQNIAKDIIQVDQINQFKMFNTPNGAKVMRIFKENGFGLLHQHNGELIPPTFSSIEPLFNGSEVLFIAEKYIEEADFYVVVYYNLAGEVVFKHAMDANNYRIIESDIDL